MLLIPETILRAGQAVSPFAAGSEIFRRAMWSVFRLENEHLHNTEGYRKIAHIPLHFDLPIQQTAAPKSTSARFLVIFEVAAYIFVVITVVTIAITVNRV
jgi:hypothetical protein